jgi:hypothetical protein
MNHHDLVAKLKLEAKKHNLQILNDDFRFVGRQLYKMSYDIRKAAVRRYVDEWRLGMQQSPNAVCAQNMGRRRANLYLFELLE